MWTWDVRIPIILLLVREIAAPHANAGGDVREDLRMSICVAFTFRWSRRRALIHVRARLSLRIAAVERDR